MRLLSIHSCIDPMTGGHENTCYELARNIVITGIKPFLLTQQHRTPSEAQAHKTISKSGCKVINIPINARSMPALFYLVSILFGFKIIKKEHIDIIHVHQVHSAFFCYILKILTKSKLVLEYRGYWRKERVNAAKLSKIAGGKKIIDLLLAFIEGFAFKVSDLIVTNHPTFPEYIIKTYDINPSKIIFVSNGVDFDIFKKEERNISRDRTVVDTDHFRLPKGQNILIKSIPKIIEIYPDVKFVFPGDGPLLKATQTLVQSIGIEKNTIFTGQLDRAKMASLLSSSEVCVSQLVNEPLGLSASHLEPIAAGKPLVTRHDPFIYDIFKTSVFYVNPKDPEEIAEVIIGILANPNLASKRAVDANQTLKSMFSWKNSVLSRANCFKNLVVSSNRLAFLCNRYSNDCLVWA